MQNWNKGDQFQALHTNFVCWLLADSFHLTLLHKLYNLFFAQYFTA
jgi:hypothetical protein